MLSVLDAKQVKLFAVKEIKLNPRKWVKKYESQIGELDKHKLKDVALHGGIGKGVHMTQLIRLVTVDLETIDLVG